VNGRAPTPPERLQSLQRFLRTIQKPDFPLDDLGEDDSLVESGLIDSLAVLQIVSYLEETYGIDFADRGLDPDELRSVRSILELVERETR
jgi:acyl carrier protein